MERCPPRYIIEEMEKLTVADFKKMLDTAMKNISAREEEFSKLDAVTGDRVQTDA